MQPAASLQTESDVTFYDNRVDPIRYAWERCNPGVSFPSLLARSVGPSPTVTGQSAARRAPVLVHVDPEISAVRAALHSLIVGPRRHRNGEPRADRAAALVTNGERSSSP